MKNKLKLLFLLILLICIFVIAIDQENSLIVRFFSYEMDVNLGVFIAAQFLLIMTVSYSISAAKWTFNIKKNLHNYFSANSDQNKIYHLSLAIISFLNEKHDKVISELKLIDKSMTGFSSLSVRYMMAESYRLQKNYDRAAGIYLDLLCDSEIKFFALKGLIRTKIAQNKYEDALVFAEEAYQLNMKDHELLSMLMSVYEKLECYDKISSSLKKEYILKMVDDTRYNLLYIQNLMRKLHKMEENRANAQEQLSVINEILEFDPDHFEALHKLVILQRDNFIKSPIIQLIRDAYKLSPHEELASLIIELFEKESDEKIIEQLEILINHSPSENAAHFVLARFLMARELFEPAKDVLEKLRIKNLKSPQLAKLLLELDSKTDKKYYIDYELIDMLHD